MKITRVDAYSLKMPERPVDASQVRPAKHGDYYIAADAFTAIYTRRRETTLVRIETDTGIVGWGESQAPVASKAVKQIVEELCTPLLLGRDPFETKFIWYRLYSAMRERGHMTGFYPDAPAGVDIALHDLLGKALGIPVYRLLGGPFRDRVPVYDSGIEGSDPEHVAVQSARSVSRGYRAVKLHVRVSNAVLEQMVKMIRVRVGDKVEVMVDIHTERDVSGAIELGRLLEPLHVRWLETPTAPEDIEGNAEVARGLTMQVAGGEWLRTSYEWKRYLEKRAFDVAMPDIGRTGLSEGIRIASMCDVYNIPVSPHIGNGMALITAANIHLSAAIPNFQILEHVDAYQDENTSFTRGHHDVVDGAFVLDDRPGLGVEVNEDAVAGLSTA